MASSKYRRDIDGLRAYAVIPVVLYHLNFQWMSGGFVGVDIFFVISGYLITNLIYQQVLDKKFSFATFYSRRVKRLFPAVFFTIFISLIVGYFVFTKEDFGNLGGSAVFSATGTSNFFFWMQAGYWDPGKLTKPLLHTWSLAVEEQFYLIWPALIVALLSWRAKIAWVIVLILGTASLILAEYMISYGSSAAFFLMPFRICEFTVGALIVWLPKISAKIVKSFFLLVGLIIIILSSVLIDETMRFPGLVALIPCIGTALCLIGGKDSHLSWFMTNELAVWIGKISYSLYLVHWPLIVFWSYSIQRDFVLWEQVAILSLSFILAALSYSLVEQPFRKTKRVSASTFSIASASLCILIITMASILWKTTDELASTAELKRPSYGGVDCTHPFCKYDKGIEDEVVVTGDSHGRMLYAGLKDELGSQNIPFSIFHFDSWCRFHNPKIKNIDRNYSCETRQNEYLKYIEENQIKTIILSYRWTKLGTHLEFKDRGRFNAEKTLELLGIPEMSSVKAVVLVLPHPEFTEGLKPAICVKRALSNPDLNCTRSHVDDHLYQRRLARLILDAHRELLSKRVEVKLANPFRSLCPDGKSCVQIIDNESLFSDEHHLSEYGSRFSVSRWNVDW